MLHACRPLLLVVLSAFAYGDNTDLSPQTEAVEPRVAKAGTVVTIKGLALDKSKVDEVYLTDHRFDLKVKVLQQSYTLLEIRIPPFVKPGRLQLLYLSAGAKPAYLEQPFFIQILDKDEEIVQPRQVTTSSTKKHQKPTVEVASIAPQIPVGPAPQTREIVPAKVVKRTPVLFPGSTPFAGGGSIEVLAVVDTKGRVKEVKIVKGHPVLAQSAASAIRQWIYEPARVNGHPVESDVPIVLTLKGK